LGAACAVAKGNCGFVEVVLWVGRTGLPWRDLLPHLGHWHRVFVHFGRWRTRGVWTSVKSLAQKLTSGLANAHFFAGVDDGATVT